MLSTVYGVNTGICKLLGILFREIEIFGYMVHFFMILWTGLPFIQNHVRGPKWLPFVVGVLLNCYLDGM